MKRQSLAEFLEVFERHGAEIAYAHRRGYRWERWSYAEVSAAARGFARELGGRGVGRGEHVLLWGENAPEWVAAFFGCVLRGAVVVPLDVGSSEDFAQRVARQVSAKLLVAGRAQAGKIPNLPALVLEDLRGALARPAGSDATGDGGVNPLLRRSDTLQIIFTSGTTAEPKGVVITHGNVLSNLEPLEAQIGSYLKYEWLVHPLRFLNLVPLSHVFGQFLGILIPPVLGGTVIFLDTLSPSEVTRAIRRERVSVLVAVPRLLESLRGKIERDAEAKGRFAEFRRRLEAAEGIHFLRRWWKFRHIRRQFGWKFWACISGGAALDPETENFWRRLGYAVIQGYGLTETTSLISVNHPFRTGKGSIGRVLAGRDVRLAGDGEILVRGDSVAAGYWQGGRLQPAVGEDGWFSTGDLGELGPDGHLYFKGRKKNVIVTAEGLNVYPEDLEAALRQQPEVREAVVVSLERHGNAEPCAVLLLREGADAEPAVRRANESLAEYQRIRRWHVWPDEDFPRTPTHKPRVTDIRRAAAELLGESRPQEMTAQHGELAALITRVTGRPPANLSPHARLATDLGLTSIERVELLSALEDRFQISLSEEGFTAATTVGELEQVLRATSRVSSAALPDVWEQNRKLSEEQASSFELRMSNVEIPVWPQHWLFCWIRTAVWYLLLVPVMAILAWPRVRGRESLRGVNAPVLVVSNHITFLDPAFVLAGLPLGLRHRLAVAMQGERLMSLQHPPRERGWLLGLVDRVTYVLLVLLFNVFPLPQRSGFRQSFAFAGESVDRRYSVLVFPEGGRTPDGRVHEFRAGIGLLTERLRLPVVPVRIDGLFELKQKPWYRRLPAGRAVRVTLGSPVQFASNAAAEEIARALQREVQALPPGRDSAG